MQPSRNKTSTTGRWLSAVAVAAALLAGQVASAQPSGTGTTAVVPSNARAQMWAATARFVYEDDPALEPIKAQLLQTVKDTGIPAFNRGVDAAVRVEQQRFPQLKHVLKFQGMVKTIQDKADPNDFGGLGQSIVAELRKNPERMADLERKSSLNALANQLNRLATGTATTATDAANTAPTLTDIAPAAVQNTEDDQFAVADSLQQPETAYDTSTSSPTPAMPTSATSPLLWAALLMSGFSLLGVLYLLLTRKPAPAPRQRSSSQDAGLNETQFVEVRTLVRKELNAQASARSASATPVSSDSVAKTRTSSKSTTARPPAPAPTPRTTPEPAVHPPSEPEPTDHLFAVETPAAPVVAEPAAPRAHTIYANQQPINGTFLRDNLADAPASYTIFEILVDERTPDQGIFVVTRNESGHGGYIGSHMSILEPACTYNYPAGSVSRIVTETPGTVQRTPSGDWRINQKAHIHFV